MLDAFMKSKYPVCRTARELYALVFSVLPLLAVSVCSVLCEVPVVPVPCMKSKLASCHLAK